MQSLERWARLGSKQRPLACELLFEAPQQKPCKWPFLRSQFHLGYPPGTFGGVPLGQRAAHSHCARTHHQSPASPENLRQPINQPPRLRPSRIDEEVEHVDQRPLELLVLAEQLAVISDVARHDRDNEARCERLELV